MNKWMRLFYYLLINVVVSACTTLVVLAVWDRTHAPAVPLELETTLLPTSSGVGGIPDTQPATTPVALLDLTPTDLPRPVSLEYVEEYQVLFGDTLGLIAMKFDVSIESIMEVNQISDPNSLPVGMLLYIPLSPDAIPTKTPSPSKTPVTGTPVTPAGTPQETKVIINSVIGVGDITSERVFITRSGDGDLSLAGWQLKDEDGNVFIFPQLALYRSGGVNVWTTTGTQTVVDLYWGLQASIWQSGEEVVLFDERGKERARYTVP
jgi:LysM repeat protein